MQKTLNKPQPAAPEPAAIDWKIVLVLLPFTCFCIALLFSAPIPQSEHYHLFADDRFWLIPNFMNVFSNLIFMFTGYYAALNFDFSKLEKNERIYLLTFVVGVFFTGYGSMYYHLIPNSNSLVWDRLPMSIAFGGFTSWVLSKTIFKNFKKQKLDFYAYIFLVLLSFGSVLYWSYTQDLGRGDLRIYYAVQFGAIATTLMALLIYDKSDLPKKPCSYLFVFYILAKLVESFDKQIYQISHHIVSGHPLKHLLAGFGCYLFLRYLKKQ